ncbi:MAG TPA: hypothetical protein VIV15_14200 [Anaerolineales bacterium]
MGIIDITGTWEVKITASGGTQVPVGSKWNAYITATQNGTTVTGTFETDMGLYGQITGIVSGDEVSMIIVQDPIFPGTFHGVAKVNTTNEQMKGTYSGADSMEPLQASFTAFKKIHSMVMLKRHMIKLGIEIAYLIASFIVLTNLLAPLLSGVVAFYFYNTGHPTLFLISIIFMIASILAGSFLFKYILLITRAGDDLTLLKRVIFRWEMLLSMFIGVLTIYLCGYALGIKFHGW